MTTGLAVGPVEVLARALADRVGQRFPRGCPFTGAAVALDGSASMRAAYGRREVDALLHLVLGLSVVASSGFDRLGESDAPPPGTVPVVRFDTAVAAPSLIRADRWQHVRSDATGGQPLASGSLQAPAMEAALASLPHPGGLVVTITDGPPADLARVAGLVGDHPGVRWLHLVTGHAAGHPRVAHWSGLGSALEATDDLTRLRKRAPGLVVVPELDWTRLTAEAAAVRVVDALADHFGATDAQPR